MMTRSGNERRKLTLIVTGIVVLVGLVSGFVLFRIVTLRLAMIELDHHSWRYMLRAENSSQASEHFLNSMAAAALPACSDAEIALMHHLLFESEFLKDGGRMSDGSLECDALFRTSELSKKVFTPQYRLKDGTQVFTDLRMVEGDPEPRVGVERGGFFVSFLHWRPDRLGNIPLKFTLTEVDDTARNPGWLHGEFPPAAASVLARSGWARVGDNLYATHCSPNYHNCFTAYVDTKAVLAARTGQSALASIFGGIFGGFIGYFCVLLYHRNQSMVFQLRRAIRAEKLRMVYQPIVNLSDRRIVEAEALVRWTDDDGFDISPELFVRVAESNGLISELTELTVRLVLRDLGELLRGRPDFSINVNVTGTDLADPGLLPMLRRSLYAAKVATENLTIEVTESSTAKKEVAVETIRKLRESGHSVHIDDFGTGYSSLSYLHSLAVDAIKIDKSFTHTIGTEAVTSSILPQILAMARVLNLEVIAEGIETEGQADYFVHYDQPILGQGWLFGKPMPAEPFRRLLIEDEERASSILVPPSSETN